MIYVNSKDDLVNGIYFLVKSNGYILKQTKNNVKYIDNNNFRIYFTYLNVENTELGKVYSFIFQIKKRVKSGSRFVWKQVGEKKISGQGTRFESDFKNLLKRIEDLGYLGFTIDNVSSDVEKELEKIAQDNLDIETLKTRKSDELDFHEVSVWGLRSALIEAYELGLKSKK